MKNLKLYTSHSQYVEPTDLPNVSYCQTENEVHLKPKPHDYSQDYLTIESLEDENALYFGSINTLSANFGSTIFYSLDNGATWEQYTASKMTSQNTPILLDMGSKVLFKTMNSVNHYDHFYLNKTFKTYGNVMSLIYGDEFIGQNNLNGIDHAFDRLFYGNGNLIDASNLILPATTLTNYCYQDMFMNCTSLTTAPELPATTLAEYCYYYMFQGCSGLTAAPVLPASTLIKGCYSYMFKNCSSLNYVKVMGINAFLISATDDWLDGVSSTGTFIKASGADWGWNRTSSLIPSGWTVETASA